MLEFIGNNLLASESFQGVNRESQQWEQCAEDYRNQWTKEFSPEKPLPPLDQKIQLRISRGKGNGLTKFNFKNDQVTNFSVMVTGKDEHETQYRVLPHEVMHTVMASYMKTAAPRWADEGYAGYKELDRTRYPRQRIIPFKELFNAQVYPQDVLNFYGESLSVVEWFCSLEGGHLKFRDFLYDFLHTQGDWPIYLKKHYGFEGYEDAQKAWQLWLSKPFDKNIKIDPLKRKGVIVDVSN